MDKQAERSIAVLTSDSRRRQALETQLAMAGYLAQPPEPPPRQRPAAVIADLSDPAVRARVAVLCEDPGAPALVAWASTDEHAPVVAWLPDEPDAAVLRCVLAAALGQRLARHELARLQRILAADLVSDDAASRLRGLAAIGEASLKLHHDINNPLCSISLNAQLLLMHLASKLEPKLIDKLRSIEANSDRIRQMTQHLAEVKQRSQAQRTAAQEASS